MRRFPRELHNKLAKAQNDLEWVIRMFHQSTVPDAVDVNKHVEDTRAALLEAQAWAKEHP